ncbi:DUF3696 domain-containing protein [Paraclostridium bifermentans]
MIKSMQVSKFKAFNTTQHANLRKITLVYGENSAGKSSLIQSILLLKQSMNEYGIDNTALIPKGKFIDLGNYQEMVYGHDNSSNIKISHEFTLNNENNFQVKKWKNKIQTLKYESVFSCDESRIINLEEINLYYNDLKKPFITLSRLNNKPINSSKRVTMIKRIATNKRLSNDINSTMSIKYINKDHELLKYIHSSYKKFNKKSIDSFYDKLINEIEHISIDIDGFMISGVGIITGELNKNIIEMLNNATTSKIEDLIMIAGILYRNKLDSVVYLGPLRDYPERHYIFSGNSPINVGKSGKYTNDLLFTGKELISEVNEWLGKFNINYKMSITELRNETISDVYSMRLIDNVSNISVSPLDVGFGISQILPIIVQSLISKNSTICIEQPEIHIHPKLQAELGTFFSECIKSNNQFIIETHSEHLMLRIQKLIREGVITNKDVSVIYIDRQNDGSKCMELRLDEDGDFIDEWPNGFFEEGYEEMF